MARDRAGETRSWPGANRRSPRARAGLSAADGPARRTASTPARRSDRAACRRGRGTIAAVKLALTSVPRLRVDPSVVRFPCVRVTTVRDTNASVVALNRSGRQQLSSRFAAKERQPAGCFPAPLRPAWTARARLVVGRPLAEL